MTAETVFHDRVFVIGLTDEDLTIAADICFDSKRTIGCFVCPLWECPERDL